MIQGWGRPTGRQDSHHGWRQAEMLWIFSLPQEQVNKILPIYFFICSNMYNVRTYIRVYMYVYNVYNLCACACMHVYMYVHTCIYIGMGWATTWWWWRSHPVSLAKWPALSPLWSLEGRISLMWAQSSPTSYLPLTHTTSLSSLMLLNVSSQILFPMPNGHWSSFACLF